MLYPLAIACASVGITALILFLFRREIGTYVGRIERHVEDTEHEIRTGYKASKEKSS